MKIGVVSIFPELVQQVFCHGVGRRALSHPDFSIEYLDLREYGIGKHKRIDDTPYGGGPGMVLSYQPLAEGIRAMRSKLQHARVLLASPQGALLTQSMVRELAKQEEIILVAGRYEGVDERLIETEIDQEFSIGDYIITGGELAIMVVLDALVRLIPGILGDASSAEEESFSQNLLEYPQYTRPQVVEGKAVPDVLLSGNHEKIKQWRRDQMVVRTNKRRLAKPIG